MQNLIMGMTMEDEQSILLVLNHPIVSSQDLNQDYFEVKLNGEAAVIDNIIIDSSNAQAIIIQMQEYMSFQDNITVSMYEENYVLSVFDDYLPSFENYPIQGIENSGYFSFNFFNYSNQTIYYNIGEFSADYINHSSNIQIGDIIVEEYPDTQPECISENYCGCNLQNSPNYNHS